MLGACTIVSVSHTQMRAMVCWRGIVTTILDEP